MLKQLAVNFFKKHQYDDELLIKIAKIINPLWYLTIPFQLSHKKIYPNKNMPSIQNEDKFNNYKQLHKSTQDAVGFIETEQCDSLLFTSLLSVANPGNSIQLKAARNFGQWFRRPVRYEPCYKKGSKGSTISRDLLLGLLFALYKKEDIQTLVELQEYGEKNHWVMGQGDISRIYFTPNMRATLALIIHKLTNQFHLDQLLPISFQMGLEGFECHLSLIHIELLGDIKGYITPKMLSVIKDAYIRRECGALAVAMMAKWKDTVYNRQASLLLGCDLIWPSNRLPTSHDRKEPWVTQRGPSSDGWLPSEDENVKVHSGGDFMFCYHILYN